MTGYQDNVIGIDDRGFPIYLKEDEEDEDDDVRIVKDLDAETSGIGDLLKSLISVGNHVLDNMSAEQRSKIEAEVLSVLGFDNDDDGGHVDD